MGAIWGRKGDKLMAGEMDEVSKAIGKLQGKMEGMVDSHKVIFVKLENIHADLTNQKVNTAKLAGKIGFMTSIVTYGIIKGIGVYIKSQGGT